MYKRILSVMLVILICLTLLSLPAAASVNIDAAYSDGVVAVSGTDFTSSTSYTVRVVDTANSHIKAMGQATADGNGNISVSITTGTLAELGNYVVYINNLDGTLAGSALISGIVAGSVDATYSDGVVTVVGEGLTSGTSYTVRIVDTVNSHVKAMGQVKADGNGNIFVSITTGVLEELDNYVVYVNNPDGTLAAADNSIEGSSILYTATIKAGIGGRMITGISGRYAPGATITLEASADSGYTFSRWTSSGGGQFENAYSASTTFSMPAADVIITANFTYIDGGGIVIPPPTEEDKAANDALVEIQEDTSAVTGIATTVAEVDEEGIAKAQLMEDQISKVVDKIIEEALKQQNKVGTVIEIKIEADESEDVKGFGVELPKSGLNSIVEGKIDTFKITTPIAEVSFDSKAIGVINDSASDTVSISVSNVDKAHLKPEVQEVIGDRPVYDFTITSGENIISDLGGGAARLSIPYTPKVGENQNAIVVYHIIDDGELVIITDCIYDAETGRLIFKLNHFSKYAVGYNNVEFTDTEGSWAEDYITYLSARNIINGDGTGKYSPGDNTTRAEFIKILAGIAGIAKDEYKSSAFQDVDENAWYAPYVTWAAEKGIAKGFGNGLFGPNDYVTREQIALMITRFVEVQNYTLPEIEESVEFADSDKISSYAREAVEQVQRAGIVYGRPAGAHIVFEPLGNLDRAEASKMLAVLMQSMMK